MYKLMNKDICVATFDLGMAASVEIVTGLKVFDKLPLGCTEKSFRSWLSSRSAAKHRSHIAGYLNMMQASTIRGFIELTHSVSINDTYWVCKDTELLSWDDVSVFSNDFDEVIQHLAFDGVGLHGVQMSSTSPEFGTNGAYEKCWKREPQGIYLYKRGTEGFANAGLEPYSESLASEVFTAMKSGIEYKLVVFRHKVASKCKLFNDEHVGFVPYSVYSEKGDDALSILDFYEQRGWGEAFRRMLVCDAITFNTDRHFGNFGFLFNTDTLELIGPAPAFDYNLALFPMEMNDAFADVEAFIHKYTPKLFDSFIAIAKHVLTSDIRSDLINLSGFKYTEIDTDKFSKSRCDWLTSLSNQQIDKVLGKDTSPVYISPNKDAVSNTYRYRLKYGFTDEDAWRVEVPRLMKVLGISHMSELEERIVDLI